MPSHEQAVIDGFNSYLRERAEKAGSTFEAFALDAQDRDAGADYLLSGSNRLALVEFKYVAGNISTESKKPRRRSLCQRLEETVEYRALHDRCHFICWSVPAVPWIELNVYRHEVCNSKVLGASSGVSSDAPRIGERVCADKFVGEFLHGSGRSLSLDEFERYLSWLLALSTGKVGSTLELVARDTAASTCAVVMFRNVRQAHEWLQTRR